MKLGRPRKLADKPCAFCGRTFRPKLARRRFCCRGCRDQAQVIAPPVPRSQYAYDGRISDALWREIHAARAEQATAPLYRPGAL